MVMKQLHLGAKWLFRLRGIGIFIVSMFIFGSFLIPLFLTTPHEGSIFSNFYFLLGILILVLLLVWIEVYTQMAYNRWFYEFIDNQLRVEKGVIWKRYSNIPYQRIQNVDITRGIIARICGFSSVNIQTAGYSAPANARGNSEGYIPAVASDEAEKIREFLMRKINKKNSSGL